MPKASRALRTADIRQPSVDRAAARILVLRDQRVLIDADLAALYGVSTKALNQAVKRNRKRFPADFIFQLTRTEHREVVTKRDHLRMLRFSPALPRAFTEHGAIMAATVLNSPRAVEMSVFVVRAFLYLRKELGRHKMMASKLDELERRVGRHDRAISELLTTIRQLSALPAHRRRGIGFTANLDDQE